MMNWKACLLTAPLFYAGAPGKDKYQTFVNFVTFSIGYRF